MTNFLANIAFNLGPALPLAQDEEPRPLPVSVKGERSPIWNPSELQRFSLISLGQSVGPIQRRAGFFGGSPSPVPPGSGPDFSRLHLVRGIDPLLVQEADRLAKQARMEWGVDLKPGNPFHYAMAIFGESKSPEELRSAYQDLKNIFIESQALAGAVSEEQLASLYQFLDANYSYGAADSLIEALKDKKADCDIVAYIALAYAYEKNWPLYFVMAPSHAFTRWEDGSTRYNIDLGGGVYSDQEYIDEMSISDRSIQSGTYLRNLSFEELIGVFLTLRAGRTAKAGEEEKALADYTEAMRLDPRSLFAHWNRGELHYKLGDLVKGNADLNVVLAMDPSDEMAWLTMGRENYRGGNFREASRSFQKVLALTGGPWSSLWNNADLYFPSEILLDGIAEILVERGKQGLKEKRFGVAKWTLNNATQLLEVLPQESQKKNRGRMVSAFYNYAQAAHLAGDEVKAEEAMKKAIDHFLKTDNFFALFRR